MRLPFALQPGETVLTLYRRHWIHLVPHLPILIAVALALPLALGWLALATNIADPVLAPWVSVAAAVAGATWAIFWLVRAYLVYYRYRHDIWVLTNQRLVDSYKAHWFHHRLATADLVNIQDISVHREGLLQTLLNFGNVACETAGEQQHFTLSGIPKPSESLAELDRARDAARAGG